MTTSIRPRASQSVTPAPIPRGPDGRAIRLSSIRQSTPFRLDAPITPRFINHRPKPQCRNKECPQSKVGEIDGKSVCLNCGFVLQESQITQELTFGEASNGAAIVQGAYVGQDEEVARNPQMAGNRMGGGMSSREQTERNGSHFMNSLVQALRLQQIDKERGMKYFKLAASNNFIQGRISRHVSAVCLYLACRGEQTCKVMLIDFADILTVNVFKLGQIYNDLVEALHLAGQGIRGNLYECNPENLIQRFAQDLEFGPDEHKIANEAVGILQRMRRDWIYTGRRPAGVCGAALILAARMNNYRRTVREVVYTAKVADVTINKRLDEFKFTDSSKLTVKEFRDFAHNLEKAHDPPAYYRQFQKKKLRKSAKRKRDEMVDQDDEEDDRALTVVSRGSSIESEEEALTREERDQRAMPPPAIPIDPQLQDLPAARGATISNGTPEIEEQNEDGADDDTERPVVKRSRGRPKGSKNAPLPVKTAVAIADEEQTEIEMLEALADPENIAQAESYHHQILPTPPPTQEAVITTSGPSTSIDLDSIIIGDDEFEDDPEVRDCLLPPEDVVIKEAVWVTNNGKWLKDQQARKIKQELAEKSGTAKVTKTRKRHRPRLGDMTAYDIHHEDGTVTRPETAAEATRMMLEKRGYSKKINYDAIVGRVYNRSPSEESGSNAGEYRSFLRSGNTSRKNGTSGTSKDTAKRRRSIAEEADTELPVPAKVTQTSSKMKRNPVAPGRRRGVSQQEDVYTSERSDLVSVLGEAAPAEEDGDGDEDDEDDEDEVEEGEGGEGYEEDDDFTDHCEEYE